MTDPIFNTVYTYTFVALRTIFLSHSKLIDGNQPLPRVGILFQDIAYGIRYAEIRRDEGTISNDIHRWKWIKKWPFICTLRKVQGSLIWKVSLRVLSKPMILRRNQFRSVCSIVLENILWKIFHFFFFFFLTIRNITFDFCNINFELVRKLDGIIANTLRDICHDPT